MSLAVFLILYFSGAAIVCGLTTGGDTYRALGVVNGLAAAVITFPILRDIMTEPDCDALTRIVLLFIFGSPIWLSFMFTPLFTALFVTITDKAGDMVSSSINRNLRK